MSGRRAASLIATIYLVWFAATIALWLLGASSTTTAIMVGGPIGWTIGLGLLVALDWTRPR